MKKLPLISLLLLLLTYSLFGWLIFTPYRPQWYWLIGAVYVVAIALVLTAPLTLIRIIAGTWLQSDARAFLSVIFSSLAVVLILCWIHVFIRILVLMAAGALARLDLQTAAYGEWQSFWILLVFSLAGYSLGVVARWLLIVGTPVA